MRGELGGGADRSASGGGASSAVGQTGGLEGRCGGITGSLVLVLAVYRALSLLLSMASIVVHC